jgi:hypothetical protein
MVFSVKSVKVLGLDVSVAIVTEQLKATSTLDTMQCHSPHIVN